MPTAESISQKIDELTAKTHFLKRSLAELFALIVACKDLLNQIFSNFPNFLQSPASFLIKAKTRINEAKINSQVFKAQIKELQRESNQIRDSIKMLRGGKGKRKESASRPRKQRPSLPSKGRIKLTPQQEIVKLKKDLQ